MKKNVKIAIAFILGFICSSTVAYAATIIASKEVLYDNSKSKLESTDVQGALDELYTKAESCGNGSEGDVVTTPNVNIVKAYIYNESTCKKGEEVGCVATTCYKNKTVGSCEPGTIIKYKVNNSKTETFNVLHDDGEVITLQTLSSPGAGSKWYVMGSTPKNNSEPIDLINSVQGEVDSWTNIPLQQYKLGSTVFKDNAYTGCSASGDSVICTTNTYTGVQSSRRARTITVQEAVALGCKYEVAGSCPAWIGSNWFWTMSACSNNTTSAWVMDNGELTCYRTNTEKYYKPVVVIKKED